MGCAFTNLSQISFEVFAFTIEFSNEESINKKIPKFYLEIV